MKITNHTPISTIIKQTKKEEPQTPLSSDPITAARQIIQEQITKIQEARNDKGEDDPKVQRIMNKLKSGKKLSPQELAYIGQNAPGQMEYIQKTLQKRELMERRMELAPTKVDVQLVAIQTAKQIEKMPNEDERKVLMNHLIEAKKEYEQTEEYKEKPDTAGERENLQKLLKTKETKKLDYEKAISAYNKQNM